MKQYIRFDSVGGASGDMILASLVGLGVDLAALEKTLCAFLPEPMRLRAASAAAAGLNGLRLTVRGAHAQEDQVWPDAEPEGVAPTHGHGHAPTHGHGHAPTHGHGQTHGHGPGPDGGHAHRGLGEITALLAGAPLSDATRVLAQRVFQELAEAEAAIHGKTPETVHFHEVGAWDAIADIVGACLALEQLDVSGVSCGPLPAGCGTIRCAHGEMPNPAPATQALLAGMTIVQTDEPFELVTPTGAALLRVWTRMGAPVPSPLCVCRSAFGFGSRPLESRPNVLRATLLESVGHGGSGDETLVLETNLDDCNPEWIGALTADLLTRGALDVWQTPVVMKKGRPGVVLSVLASAASADLLREWIFRATTTFGIRSHAVRRETLDRRMVRVETPWGEVPVKVGMLQGEPITRSPEHEACAALAAEHGVTPRQVAEAARCGGHG